VQPFSIIQVGVGKLKDSERGPLKDVTIYRVSQRPSDFTLFEFKTFTRSLHDNELWAITASILEALHQLKTSKIDYRNLNSNTVGLFKEGNEYVARLFDFSESELIGDEEEYYGLCGDPYSMAPEQLAVRDPQNKDALPYDRSQAIVFQLGVMLLELAFKKQPLKGWTLEDKRSLCHYEAVANLIDEAERKAA